MPMAIVARSDGVYTAKMPVVVTGVIGSDTHIVGNRILSMALEQAGYKVVTLGALTPAAEFIKAAIETNADAILVSSLYGQGELDCRGFRDLCVEAGLEDILLYVGGNLVVGKQAWPDVEKRFLDMGFDRAASPEPAPKPFLRGSPKTSRIASAGMREAMTTAALLIDFGSTYTKLRAIDLDRRCILGSGQGPSTVTTDIMIGMKASLDDLERRLGGLPRFKYRLASSSAAGGLRMVTVGLVRELTAEAARRAALGAGAKLVGAFAYRLTTSDVERIVSLAPDILLLAGGTDGGNSDVILHNAEVLGRSALTCPVVLAGNRNAADDARSALAGREVLATENVMPELNVLHIEPARGAIRQVFIDRIVHAKGIDRAHAEFDRVLMPTPAAVLDGARMLADGCGGISGLGALLVVDPGGATTDVHSVASGDPSSPGVIVQGLPEPRVARTVEGDLGMRHNAANIVELVGVDAIAAEAGLDAARVNALVAEISGDFDRLPRTADEIALDRALVCAAVRHAVIAALRHGGHCLHRNRSGCRAAWERPVRGERGDRHRWCAGTQPGSPLGAGDGARRSRDAPFTAAESAEALARPALFAVCLRLARNRRAAGGARARAREPRRYGKEPLG